MWLSVIAHNLGNLWRRLVLPKWIENCDRSKVALWCSQTRLPVEQTQFAGSKDGGWAYAIVLDSLKWKFRVTSMCGAMR